MKTSMILVCGFLMCSIIGTGSADVWTDPFDGNEPLKNGNSATIATKLRSLKSKMASFK